MKKMISIEGMTCGHCVGHVADTLNKVEGVMSVSVDLAGKKADVDADESVSDDTLKAAVKEAGYTATAVAAG